MQDRVPPESLPRMFGNKTSQDMSNENSNPPTREDVQMLSADIQRVAAAVDELEVAALDDMIPKVERLQTMEHALRRNFDEQSSASGADDQTVVGLYAELRRETTDLDHEMGALGQGAPTTLSAGVDAVIKVVDSIKGKMSKNDQA